MLFSQYSSSFVTFLIVLISLSNPSVAAEDSLEPLWGIPHYDDFESFEDPNGGYMRGECDGDMLSNLQTSYTEARNMIKAAQSAIEILTTPRPSDTTGSEWNRMSTMFTTMFGIQLDPNVGGVVKGPSEVYFFNIQENYKDMLATATYTGDSLTKNYLTCGAAYFHYIDRDHADPTDPANRPLRKTHEDWPAAWYDSGYGPGDPSVSPPPVRIREEKIIKADAEVPNDMQGNPGQYFCKSDGKTSIQAFCSLPNLRIMNWCPKGGLQSAFVTLRGIPLQEGDEMDIVNAMSNIWVHELAHYATNAVVTDPPVVREGTGINGLVYGFKAVKEYAAANPGLASSAADAYSLFAQAMFLDDWDWSDGTAKAIPEATQILLTQEEL